MTEPNAMLVVYDRNTKCVLWTVVNTAKLPTHEDYCPDKQHNSKACFVCPIDLDVENNSSRYYVDDTNPNAIRFLKFARYKIVCTCNKTVIGPNSYQMTYTEVAELTFAFKDENNNPVMPNGTFKIRPSRGKVVPTQIILTGVANHVVAIWTPPEETVDVKIIASLNTWPEHLLVPGNSILTVELI